MKTQKEALALKLKIDELRKLQEETRRKAREAEMRREGIPLNRSEEVLFRRFHENKKSNI